LVAAQGYEDVMRVSRDEVVNAAVRVQWGFLKSGVYKTRPNVVVSAPAPAPVPISAASSDVQPRERKQSLRRRAVRNAAQE
jgi:hypothetical protein